jgi:hypothetical protein
MMLCLNVKCDDEIMTAYTQIPDITKYLLQIEPKERIQTSDSLDSYISYGYNYICEHKVRLLVILGVTILIVGGCYMYPDADINIHYSEPPKEPIDPKDLIPFDKISKMSDKAYNAWFKNWIKKP